MAVAAVLVVQPQSSGGDISSPQLAAAQRDQAPTVAQADNRAQQVASASQQVLVPQQQRLAGPLRSSSAQRAAGAQLVAAGHSGARSGGRELVIATPAQERPVSAQWAMAGNAVPASQQPLQQQRVREKLNTYLINHARHGGGAALTGSLGYARVAARPVQTTASE